MYSSFALACCLSLRYVFALEDQHELADMCLVSEASGVQVDCDTQLSLLQTSYYVGPHEVADKHSSFGFVPTEERFDRSMRWVGDRPRKDVQGSATSEADLQSLDERLEADLATVRAAILTEEGASDFPTFSRTAARPMPPALYARQNTWVDSGTSISWHMILIIILVACSALGLLVYVFISATRAEEQTKGAFPRTRALEEKLAAAVDGQRVGRKWFSCCGGGGQSNEGFFTREDIVEGEGEVHDIREVEPIELESDTFGMTVCSLVRDSYFLSIHGASLARVIRVITSLALVVLTIGLQVFLLAKIKEFVTAEAVSDIRDAYDKYEIAIYGEQHTTLTANGKHRGNIAMPPLDEAKKRLATLSNDDQEAVCHIPLSQPHFFGVILLVWTLICMAELKKAFTLHQHLIMLPNVSTMAEALRPGDDVSTNTDGVIEGMTILMKIFLTILMFIPRVLVTCYLLWIGCRWLLATTDFGNLVSNAVALEFILLIKEALYAALTPFRSHLDLNATKIQPFPKQMRPAWFYFVGSAILFAVANLWVYMYMHHWQAVLPGYKWDVHAVCVDYMSNK
mmetsp:Transcript_35122/g.54550  ORF Transcript_35122/g.54550 Transcript_35122/m.54550 type:complete len:570 (-) Transcript_35122:49-1758(-)